MPLSSSLIIDAASPVRRTHPWAPDAWWLCVPGLMGGAVWHDVMSLPGDLSHGHHARLTNMAGRPSATSGWQEGLAAPGLGGALAVDGTNDYADAGDHGLFSAGLSAMTWIVDLLPKSTTGFPGILGKGNSDSASSGSYLLYLGSGAYSWIVYTGGSRTTSLAASVGATLNVWQQVAATWQRSGVTALHVNGVNRAQGTGANALVDSPAFSLLFGTNQGNAGPTVYPLNALLASVRFYRNRVFSDPTLLQMYWHSRAGSPGLLRRVGPRLGVAAAGTPATLEQWMQAVQGQTLSGEFLGVQYV
jgi:hypothetical protein